MRRLIACGFESRHWYMIIKVNTNTGNEPVKASDIVRVRQDNINKCTLIMLIDDTTYSESADELFMRNAWPDPVCEGCQELEDKCSCDNLGHLWNPHCEERCCL